MDRDTILRRAAKLMQFQAGNATQAELELAAERLGALMRENNISIGDITAEQLKAHIGQEAPKAHYAQRAPAWYQRLSCWIAYACSCRSIKYGARYEFVGDKADVAIAVYFMNICAETLPLLCDLLKPKDNKAFLWGAVEAVGARLVKMVRPPEMSTQERGLIVVKSTAVNAYVENKWPSAKVIPVRINRGRDAESYAQGVAAGEKMRLNHGVNQGKESARLV